jgi:hypothetical protein
LRLSFGAGQQRAPELEAACYTNDASTAKDAKDAKDAKERQ